MKAHQIRTQFLGFFREHGHEVVKSSSLIPQNDPTLLFANAGMNQFKDVFLGKEKRAYTRATSVQKCMRAGGKHNDLDNVGHTQRHHTFFEMLGNFSFGDYFKEDAIAMAWELFVKRLGLPAGKLYATVYKDDDEAYGIWHTKVGVPADRVLRFDEKDNFWSMGETGPCGPCSEILIDQGPEVGCRRPDCAPGCSCDRYLELWNLVFMQYDRDQNGVMTPLPSPCIDTGAGLERVTAILQGVHSNFHTDLFMPIIDRVSEESGVEYEQESETGAAMRVIADHVRAATFAITDGVLPSNVGRGFVLRRILRRAMRYGGKLGYEEPFLYKLAGIVPDVMGDAYPELGAFNEHTARVILSEEDRFETTLALGLKVLEKICEKTTVGVVSGAEVFKLYDTYGFPLDLARDYCEERNLRVDEAGFAAELEKQRERARAAVKAAPAEAESDAALKAYPRPVFTGYSSLRDDGCRVVALFREGGALRVLRAGEHGECLLDRTPFYAESGGQVGDRGEIVSGTGRARVQTTQHRGAGYSLVKITVEQGEISVGQEVDAIVDPDARQNAAIHHTATHLLHAALREILGPHVKQSGSLVDPQHLRFDFSHYAALKDRELADIEDLVNREVRANDAVTTEEMPIEEALASGAMAFFGDKYGSRVRVVRIGDFSLELCGGTHLAATGQIGLFRIEAEGSIASGIRRITARAGGPAIETLQKDHSMLLDVEQIVRATRAELPAAITRLQEQLKQREKEVQELRHKVLGTLSLAEAHTREINGVKVATSRLDGSDMSAMRAVMDRWREQIGSGVVILFSEYQGKALLLAGVTKDLTKRLHAGNIVKRLAPVVGGSGGGRPDLAEAGGKDPAQIDAAEASVDAVVAEALAAARC
ncbi:MAG: alanine--tRNA ligase [Acidobacteria bacterium]|nr:alanine--tRNA ligase [Acidobacteriota bacterium]